MIDVDALPEYKYDTSRWLKLERQDGKCSGRTDGYGGFTCVNCGKYYASWSDRKICKGVKHGG